MITLILFVLAMNKNALVATCLGGMDENELMKWECCLRWFVHTPMRAVKKSELIQVEWTKNKGRETIADPTNLVLRIGWCCYCIKPPSWLNLFFFKNQEEPVQYTYKLITIIISICKPLETEKYTWEIKLWDYFETLS